MIGYVKFSLNTFVRSFVLYKFMYIILVLVPYIAINFTKHPLVRNMSNFYLIALFNRSYE